MRKKFIQFLSIIIYTALVILLKYILFQIKKQTANKALGGSRDTKSIQESFEKKENQRRAETNDGKE